MSASIQSGSLLIPSFMRKPWTCLFLGQAVDFLMVHWESSPGHTKGGVDFGSEAFRALLNGSHRAPKELCLLQSLDGANVRSPLCNPAILCCCPLIFLSHSRSFSKFHGTGVFIACPVPTRTKNLPWWASYTFLWCLVALAQVPAPTRLGIGHLANDEYANIYIYILYLT